MEVIKLAHDTLGADELQNLSAWIASGQQLTKGPLTLKFEEEFSRYLGCGDVTFVNSGSSANLLAVYGLLELGKLRNKCIIAPAISWVTTITPAIQFGMDVHLCDCNQRNLGLDLNHFESLCKKFEPSVAIIVHVLGHPNDMEALISICDRYGVILIEDSCEALGTVHQGKYLGSFGKLGTFSFYYGHQMSTIEGGMVVTQDRRLHNVIKSLRAHGWARDVDADTKGQWEKEFEIDEVRSLYTFYYSGFNCRSTDLNAFLGLSQLQRIKEMTNARQHNYFYYKKALSDKYWVQESNFEHLSSFAFGTLVENRIEVFQSLKQANIESRPLICGSMGRQPFWIKRFGMQRLPNADIIHDKGIYLPNHSNLQGSDLDRVIKEFSRVAVPCESFSQN